jgi:hypothetical protein
MSTTLSVLSNDQKQQHKAETSQCERITQVQDGYPASWSFGAFGAPAQRRHRV